MRAFIVLVAALAAVAGPAAAEFGTMSGTPGVAKPRTGMSPGPAPSIYGAPYSAQHRTMAPKPQTYGAPAASTFKPYEPYRSSPGTSVFGPDSRKKR